MMAPGGVGGLTPSKLLVGPTSDIIAQWCAADKNRRASFGPSQPLLSYSLFLVSLSVS